MTSANRSGRRVSNLGSILRGLSFLALSMGISLPAFAERQPQLGDAKEQISDGADIGKDRIIEMPGNWKSASPERWVHKELMVPGVPRTGVPEVVVLNVSRPHLEIFLPDPGKATGAAMIVAPGGSFVALAMEREGYGAARWLNERGIAAFVLKYRLKPIAGAAGMVPLKWRKGPAGIQAIPASDFLPAIAAAGEDATQALCLIRSLAPRWGISTDRIGIMGFSAGAATAVNAAIHAEGACKANLLVPVYGFLLKGHKVPPTAPPMFAVAASDDVLVPSSASVALYQAFRDAGISSELHIFEDGEHGFGTLQQGKSSDQWLAALDNWLGRHNFKPSR